MPQGWSPLAPDQRTYGLLVARVLDDLNRPDLQNIAQQYVQDAIRYYQRKPFFFNDIDNTAVQSWQPGWFFTQGATIQAQVTVGPPSPLLPYLPLTSYAQGDYITDDNGNYQLAIAAGISSANAPTWPTSPLGSITPDGSVQWQLAQIGNQAAYALVNLTAGVTGAVQPTFTPTIYTPPTSLTSPPVFAPGPGTTVDGGCLWATVSAWNNGLFTQLSTVPNQNQYVPPLDYVTPRRIEVGWAFNLRISMDRITYDQLRDYDVIRPTPPSSYPTWWAWYQQQIYFWPYPVSFYPITLSYRTAPPLPTNADDSNFWTTKAEALIRYYTDARISDVVLHDQDAANDYYGRAKEELSALVGEQIQQETSGEGNGVPLSPW